MAEKAPSSGIEGSVAEQNQNSVEATIESEVQGGTESTCNNVGSSTQSSAADVEKSLELAEDLMERASKAAKEKDYATATDCYSRALEIRVSHFGELAPECINAYYKYGCALLYKAQDEADPLGTVPNKEDEVKRDDDKEGSVKSVNGESSVISVAKENTAEEKAAEGKDKDKVEDEEEDEDESGGEDVADGEGDEDESDLDFAWKMLDVARAIVEKHSGDTMEKVDVLSALAEVALEREDIETSLSDYLKALSILERIVGPDSRYLAELNFRICLCLELGSRPEEALPYCKNAISICKSRVERLKKEAVDLDISASKASESGQVLQQSSSTTQSAISASDKESEIETLTGLSSELEKKLEDLQQLVSNPKSLLADILGLMAAKSKVAEKTDGAPGTSSSRMAAIGHGSGDFDSPTISTAHTNSATGVTDLGVVGRGVKRVLLNPTSSETVKKPSLDDGNAS